MAMHGYLPLVAEFREIQATTMSIDCRGKYALIAGKRAFGVLNLNKPRDLVKKQNRTIRSDQHTTSAWNPHRDMSPYLAVTASNVLELYQWSNSRLTSVNLIKSHTRTINDIDWSPIDNQLLASCSADSFTFIWDVRQTQSPVGSLPVSSAVTQVKWNKNVGFLLATANDNKIRIWDRRKPDRAMHTIAAHYGKVNGLDWCPYQHEQGEHMQLVSCGHDATAKIWDTQNPLKAKQTIELSSKVWRAKYTPSDQGLVLACLPHHRQEAGLILASLERPEQRLVLPGSSSSVLDFHWRWNSGSNEQQLVAWSQDQQLRIWDIAPHLRKLDGVDTEDVDTDLNVSLADSNSSTLVDSSTPYSSVSTLSSLGHSKSDSRLMDKGSLSSLDSRGSRDSRDELPIGSLPVRHTILMEEESGRSPEFGLPKNVCETLQKEFQLVNRDIPVKYERFSPDDGKSVVLAEASGGRSIQLLISFPMRYPQQPPTFTCERSTNLSQQAVHNLIQVLDKTATLHCTRGMCLEPCLRKLVNTLNNDKDILRSIEERPSSDRNAPTPRSKRLGGKNATHRTPVYSSFQDSSVPFPRSCGVSFGGNGMLVCFYSKQRVVPNGQKVPRSLDDQSAYSSGSRSYPLMSSPPQPAVDPSYIAPWARTRSRREEKSRSSGLVNELERQSMRSPLFIYDTSSLLPFSRKLAVSYRLNGESLNEVCTENARAATECNRPDLVQMWQLVAQMLPKTQPEDCVDAIHSWTQHPFYSNLLRHWVLHLEQQRDLQSLAMLSHFFIHPSCGEERSDQTTTSYDSATEADARPEQEEKPSNPPISKPRFVRQHSELQNLVFERLNQTSNLTASSMRRSNSLSEPYSLLGDGPSDSEVLRIASEPTVDSPQPDYGPASVLLPAHVVYRMKYAELLYRWGLLYQRAELLKRLPPSALHPTDTEGLQIGWSGRCVNCGADSNSVQCTSCRKLSTQCCICLRPVRGLSNFCPSCGHGGHSIHVRNWFRINDQCPASCGCYCARRANYNPQQALSSFQIVKSKSSVRIA